MPCALRCRPARGSCGRPPSARPTTPATRAPAAPRTTGSCSSTPTACRCGELLDAYFAEPIPERCGAVAGAIGREPGPARADRPLRRDRGFLNMAGGSEGPGWRIAVAGNVLVRRAAFDGLGGFVEGIRSGGDVDLSRRLIAAGWTIESRPAAAVEHHHRERLIPFLATIARYAAGSRWLERRYPGHSAPVAAASPGSRSAARDVGRARAPGSRRAGGVPRARRARADRAQRGVSRRECGTRAQLEGGWVGRGGPGACGRPRLGPENRELGTAAGSRSWLTVYMTVNHELGAAESSRS